MALTKQKKDEVIAEISALLADSKMTVVATYAGTPVKAMQNLRRSGKESGTSVRVIKNRLVIKALQSTEKTKETDTSALKGMLLYAFNPQDEVASAQVLANFSKTQTTIGFVGAFTDQGVFIGADDVKIIADLPSKDQLRSVLVGTIAAPLSSFVNILAGNVRGVLNVFSARAANLEQK